MKPEPVAKQGSNAVGPYRRGELFGIDLRQAIQRARNAVESNRYDPKMLAAMSAECEYVANTAYRLWMYAHAKADVLASTRGRTGGMDHTQADYIGASGGTHFARQALDEFLRSSKAFRDDVAKGAHIPPGEVLKRMSRDDLRRMLTNEGLNEYRAKNLIEDSTLNALLGVERTAYKRDQPGTSTDGTRYCQRECGIGDWEDCGRCARLGLESGESSYKYFVAEWNANTRWYQAWRRVELTDNLLGSLAARFSAPR